MSLTKLIMIILFYSGLTKTITDKEPLGRAGKADMDEGTYNSMRRTLQTLYKGTEVPLGHEQYFLDINVHNFSIII